VQFTLLLDGLTQTGPPQPDRWAATHGLTYPIIADQDYDIGRNYAPDGGFGIPLFAVIDRQMVIRAWGVNADVSNYVDQLLNEPAPNVDWPMP
jgi:peroxiredoxin